jgi:hypothetical protein
MAPDDRPAFGPLVMLLRLAVRQLHEPASREQLNALQRGLDVLQSSTVTSDHLQEVDRALLDSGLPADADFGDEELLRLYIEAL